MTEYPEFDAANEAAVALEGRLLRAALSSREPVRRRERIREFVAVRERRHRRLGADLAAFESAAEHNEGVAQYVYHRAIERAAAAGDPDRSVAHAAVDDELARLEAMIEVREYSLRRRFYTTGTAIGLLLDEVVGPPWKTSTIESGLPLHDLLAEASGYRERERRLVDGARSRHGADLGQAAAAAVEERRARRRERAEEILATPGVLLELAAKRPLPMCGIDPQNLLQVGDGQLLHTRWLRLCPAGGTIEFETAVVHDRERNVLRAPIGEEDAIEILIGGQSFPPGAFPEGSVETLEIRAPRVELAVDGATVQREGRVVRLEF